MKITYDELGRVSELHFEKDEDQKVLTDFILENTKAHNQAVLDLQDRLNKVNLEQHQMQLNALVFNSRTIEFK